MSTYSNAIKLAAVTTLAFAACTQAASIVWKDTIGSGNWGTDTNWVGDLQPAATDDATLAYNQANTSVTYTLGASRTINKLTISSKGTLGAATDVTNAYTMTVSSGNIDVLSSGTSGAGGVIVRTIIPDSAGASAVWNISPVHDSWTFAGVTASSAVTITKTGANNRTLAITSDNSATLAATWNISSGAGHVRVGASNAFGTGTVNLNGNQLTLPTGDNTQATNWSFTGTSFTHTGSNAAGNTTITGNISGSGTIDKTGNSTGAGGVILAGTNNTFTGNINHHRGLLALDGNFTGFGNVVMSANSGGEKDVLGGTGVVGMGVNKTITITGNNTGTKFADLAPGRDGVIGTLTMGTSGNNNSMAFNNRSRFLVDLDTATSDKLALTGAIIISTIGNQVNPALYINGTLGSTTDYTLATFTSLTGTFGSVYLNGVDITSTALDENGVGGTHQLVYGTNSLTLVTVPEPASLGLAAGALLLIGRRRRSA